jgi:hypothetical protein
MEIKRALLQLYAVTRIMELVPFKEFSCYLLHSVRHVFGTSRSVFECVGLPAVQGKCTTDLYVTYNTEVYTAGCTTDLYGYGNGTKEGSNLRT